MENKLTKHNTENSNNVQHEPHCMALSSGVRVAQSLVFSVEPFAGL
jgi:hypothetical protein